MYHLRSRISTEKADTTYLRDKGRFEELFYIMDVRRPLAFPVVPILAEKAIEITGTIKNR